MRKKSIVFAQFIVYKSHIVNNVIFYCYDWLITCQFQKKFFSYGIFAQESKNNFACSFRWLLAIKIAKIAQANIILLLLNYSATIISCKCRSCLAYCSMESQLTNRFLLVVIKSIKSVRFCGFIIRQYNVSLRCLDVFVNLENV